MSAYPMILIPEAQKIVLDLVRPLTPVTVSLLQALGRTLAADVTAPDNHPPFRASIKDGYAVHSPDGAGDFDLVGDARAGYADDIRVGPGKVVYITTGAPVPEGADAVIQVEDTERLPDSADGMKRVRIKKASKPQQDIRPVGSDIRQGDTVLSAGDVVSVAEVGILATVGAVQLTVHRQPRLGVLSTGDEVVDPSTQHLAPGQVRDSNRAMLLAAATQAGAVAEDLGVARDTMGHLEGALDAAIASGLDVLVTSGGVSMGDRDLLKPLLEKRGTIHFGRVLMKPGKPLTFATLELEGGRQMLVFGLPGNPVSSLVCFSLVVLPALRNMAGWRQPALRRVHARVTSHLKLDPERPEYHRVTLQWGRCPIPKLAETLSASAHHANSTSSSSSSATEPLIGYELWAMSTGNQISSRLLSARSANALLELPRASGVIAAGSIVSALLLDDLQSMPMPVDALPCTPGFQ